ncbi:MAG: hypothetical protein JSR73_10210 [Proteobacteria bacterium]|nr:hypothetical protein [Pseudomonadota bacterium]
MSQPLHEVALSPVEVDLILSTCGANALLVGGQSLAFWALHYDVRPAGVLAASVTMDVDFIGTSEVARRLSQRLGDPWKLRTATLDDAGSQTAKVYRVLPDNGVKQVDFLSGIVGLGTRDVERRAVEVEIPSGAVVRVLHPLDVLESRLRNLAVLPDKRNSVGVAQARLGVEIVRAYIERMQAEAQSSRAIFQAVRRVKRIALDSRLANAALEHGVDVLSAVPVEKMSEPRFHERFWPDVLAKFETRRQRFITSRSSSRFSRP